MSKPAKWTVKLQNSHAGRQIAYVIDRTNYIEYTVKNILEKYIGAMDGRSSFVRDVLLHSSVMALGQKFKVLQHIIQKEGWPTVSQDHFHMVLSIRNAFAHSDTATTKITVTLGSDGEPASSEVLEVLDTLSSSGKFRELARDKAFDEFLQNFGPLREYLHDLDRNYAGK